jgi:hypothetical protein
MRIISIISIINIAITRAILRFSLLGLSVFFSLQSSAGDWGYSVRPGDTLWSICENYTNHNNCWLELAEHNQIDKPRQLSTGTLILIPIEWLKQAPVAAKAVYVFGEVVFSTGHEPLAELISGQSLRMGSKVVVGQGSVTLLFADGATLVLSANSELIIDSSSAIKQARSQFIEVSLPRGEVQVNVPKRMPRTQFRIKTPTAVAAVRGTKFRVVTTVPSIEGESGDTRSEVLEGVVGVSSNNESQDVTAGHGVSTVGGQGLSEQAVLIAAPRWNRSCNDPGFVEWQLSLSASQYRLALMEDNVSVDQVISTVIVEGSNYVFKGLEDGCYQVKVNAVDSQGYNGLESQRQMCYQAELSAPKITEAVLNRSGLVMAWDAVEHAMRYRIEVSEREDFSTLVATQTREDLIIDMPLKKNIQFIHVRVQALADNMPASEYSKVVQLERKNKNNQWLGFAATLFAFLIL